MMRHLPVLVVLALSVPTCLALAQPGAKPMAKAKSSAKSRSQPRPAARPSATQEQAADAAFKAGAALIAEEKYRQALVQFQKALQVFPDSPGILWNAASAAFSSGQFALAARYFERDAAFEPFNG